MIGSLFLKELKRHRIPFIAGACAMVALIPAAMLLGPRPLADPLSFYAAFCLRPLMLLGSVGAAVLLSGTIRGEWMRGTAEFLLAKPGNRTAVLLGKGLACLSILAAVNAAAYMAGMAALTFLTDGEWSVGAFLTLSLYAFLPMPAFGGAGLLASLLFRRTRAFTGPVAIVSAACFLPDALSWMDGAAASAAAGRLAPLRWAELDAAAAAGGPTLLRTAVPAVLAVALFAAGWAVFRRMDVPEGGKR